MSMYSTMPKEKFPSRSNCPAWSLLPAASSNRRSSSSAALPRSVNLQPIVRPGRRPQVGMRLRVIVFCGSTPVIFLSSAMPRLSFSSSFPAPMLRVIFSTLIFRIGFFASFCFIGYLTGDRYQRLGLTNRHHILLEGFYHPVLCIFVHHSCPFELLHRSLAAAALPFHHIERSVWHELKHFGQGAPGERQHDTVANIRGIVGEQRPPVMQCHLYFPPPDDLLAHNAAYLHCLLFRGDGNELQAPFPIEQEAVVFIERGDAHHVKDADGLAQIVRGSAVDEDAFRPQDLFPFARGLHLAEHVTQDDEQGKRPAERVGAGTRASDERAGLAAEVPGPRRTQALEMAHGAASLISASRFAPSFCFLSLSLTSSSMIMTFDG